MVLVEARVTLNSREFSVEYDCPAKTLRVKLTEKAENNKANAELVKKLGERLQATVRIVRGFRGRRKLLEVDADEHEIAERARA